MTKKILILFLVGLFTLSSYNFVSAIDTATGEARTTTSVGSASSFFNIDEINKLIKEASNSANKSQQQLASVIKGADMMITNRITTLNNLISRIQGDNRLTSDEKTALSAEIQSTISGLNSLKATIDADTDVAKARSDAKKIVTDYYVFVKLEPKIRLLITLNNLEATSSNVQTLVPQVQNLINTLQGQGKDTSGLTGLLTDISSQLTTINTTITKDKGLLQGISATSKDNDTVFSTVKSDLSDIVKTDFGKIRTDFSQMKTAIRQLISGSAAPAPSATPAATP